MWSSHSVYLPSPSWKTKIHLNKQIYKDVYILFSFEHSVHLQSRFSLMVAVCLKLQQCPIHCVYFLLLHQIECSPLLREGSLLAYGELNGAWPLRTGNSISTSITNLQRKWSPF